MRLKSIRLARCIGSGTVVLSAVLIALLVLLGLGDLIGWDPTWRTFGVTPLEPHFFDMHAVTDHVDCALKGFDPYILTSCDPRTPFNYPPVWLLLGRLGINGSDSVWLSAVMIATAFAVIVAVFSGRPVGDGVIFSIAILSPSILMGVERGNIDFLILALVGAGALIFSEQKAARAVLAAVLVGLATVLKLYPVFCVALAVRLNWRSLLFATIVAAVALAYVATISDYIPIIRQNTPTSFMLSYGYKVLFLGLDHLRAEGKLLPIGLVDTLLPTVLAIMTVILAVTTAVAYSRHGSLVCRVADSIGGTAFLFGAGIYCGSYLLGTNFIYRLMFLLLCLPQLRDWARGGFESDNRTLRSADVLVAAILFALWMNGNSNGHTTFVLVPQLANWLIFFGLTTILVLNFLNNARGHRQAKNQHDASERLNKD
jgi:hypothetical protein